MLQVKAKEANNTFAVKKLKSPFTHEIVSIIVTSKRQFAGNDCFLYLDLFSFSVIWLFYASEVNKYF